jgi:hypothetical protein
LFFSLFVFSKRAISGIIMIKAILKAKIGFEELLVSVPQNMQYFEDHRLLPAVRTIRCCRKAIQPFDKYNQETFWLSYNFQLQKKRG